MNKNKGDAGNIAGFINLENELLMNKNTPNENKFQIPNFDEPENTSRRDLLESTKLSRLPERKPFRLPVFESAVAACVNCAGRLDADDTIQQAVKVCRKCLVQYATIDAAIDEASKRKRREMLERFAGGAK